LIGALHSAEMQGPAFNSAFLKIPPRCKFYQKNTANRRLLKSTFGVNFTNFYKTCFSKDVSLIIVNKNLSTEKLDKCTKTGNVMLMKFTSSGINNLF